MSDNHAEATQREEPLRICSSCRWRDHEDVEKCPACGLALVPGYDIATFLRSG